MGYFFAPSQISILQYVLSWSTTCGSIALRCNSMLICCIFFVEVWGTLLHITIRFPWSNIPPFLAQNWKDWLIILPPKFWGEKMWCDSWLLAPYGGSRPPSSAGTAWWRTWLSPPPGFASIIPLPLSNPDKNTGKGWKLYQKKAKYFWDVHFAKWGVANGEGQRGWWELSRRAVVP